MSAVSPTYGPGERGELVSRAGWNHLGLAEQMAGIFMAGRYSGAVWEWRLTVVDCRESVSKVECHRNSQ